MNIAFHDLQSQYYEYKEEINFAIQKVLNSSQFIMGPEVEQFEEALGEFLNCKHVVTCANGTDAILLALMAIDIKPGDEIITTPFTFIATAEMISLLGAIPIFVDIEADSYNINASQIEAKITAKTRAILPVSLYGQPADMDEINALAQKYSHQYDRKLYVIEDAAQSLGALYREKKSGNLSDIGCLSFFPTKPLGCYGDGGAVIVNDDLIAERIKSLRVHGQTKRYHHKYIGLNARLDTIQAAILQVKLKYFPDEIKKRSQIAKYYNEQLTNANVMLSYVKSDRTSIYAQYSIRVKERQEFMNQLKVREIPTAIHYPQPLHLQPCFNYLNHHKGDFPVAENIANEIISLPMSAHLTELQQRYIVNAVHEITYDVIQTRTVG
ncbi:MAG: DegT/DnrJ/EryC1/StrS family aminotransferase [Gammaproteobacteria bacterium]|nr:DegT/DnrJ/EryC1/StrS family aminotransferase [Gammaproteobacteria bacterium]